VARKSAKLRLPRPGDRHITRRPPRRAPQLLISHQAPQPSSPTFQTQSPTSSTAMTLSASLRTSTTPQFEHDACGVGFVANIKGCASHDIVKKGIDILLKPGAPRWATGCDPLTGDGAGIIIQVPDAFLSVTPCDGGRTIELPEAGQVRRRLCIFAARSQKSAVAANKFWRTRSSATGQPLDRLARCDRQRKRARSGGSREARPVIRQVFIGSTCEDDATFERKLFVIRKWAERAVRETRPRGQRLVLYSEPLVAHDHLQGACSWQRQAGRILHRAQGRAEWSAPWPWCISVFSTQYLPPPGSLAQPFPYACAQRRNQHRAPATRPGWPAREQLFDGRSLRRRRAPHFCRRLPRGGSDSAMLDKRSRAAAARGAAALPHVMMMLVPEAWQSDELMPAPQGAEFYEYHSCLVEAVGRPRPPLTFTDGKRIAASCRLRSRQ